MIRKLGFTLAGLAVAAASLFAVSSGTALAEDPPAPALCPGEPGDGGLYDHPWLRRSIIESASEVIGIRPSVLVQQLRGGASLEAVAAGYGIASERLQTGILRDEHEDLRRHVQAGHISPREAHRTFVWLTAHIDEIVSHEFSCLASIPDEDIAY